MINVEIEHENFKTTKTHVNVELRTIRFVLKREVVLSFSPNCLITT